MGRRGVTCHLQSVAQQSHDPITAAALCAGPAQAWACQQPIKNQGGDHGGLPLLADLLATDGNWEESHCLHGVTSGESTRFQWPVPNLWPHRWSWLKISVSQDKTKGSKCEEGTSKEHGGDKKHRRHAREGSGEKKLILLYTCVKLSKK